MVFRRLFDLYRLDLTKKKPPVRISLEYRGDLFNDDEKTVSFESDRCVV